MRIVKCDFCGAEIIERHYDNDKCFNPSHFGWAELHGTKLCSRWEKDVCPNCLPVCKYNRVEGSDD